MSPQGRRGATTGGLWLAASNAISLGSTLVLSVVMGRVLGPDELGQQSYIAYIAALLMALVVAPVTSMANRVMAQAYGRRATDEFLGLHQWTALAQMGGGVAVATVLMLMSSWSEYRAAWILAGVTVFLDGTFWGIATGLIAKRGWEEIAKARLVSQVSAATMGAMAILIGYGIAGVFLGTAVSSLGLVLWIARRQRLPRSNPLLPFPRPLVRIWGSFVVLAALSQIVSQRIEFLFLGTWSTRAELATYSIAFMAVSSAAMLPVSVIGGAGPAIAANEGAGRLEHVAESLGTAIRIMTVLSAGIAAGVAALGPPLVGFAYGPQFLSAANLTALLSIVVVAATVATLCWNFAVDSGRAWIPITAGSIAGVVDLTLAFALVRPLGSTGAALANIGGQYTLLIVILILIRREFGHVRLRLHLVLWPIAFCVLLGLVTMWLVRNIGYDTSGRALLSLIVGGAVFLMAVVAFGTTVGFVRGSDVTWLASAVPARFLRFMRFLAGRPEDQAG